MVRSEKVSINLESVMVGCSSRLGYHEFDLKIFGVFFCVQW